MEMFFAWCTNLPDEADNHLIELALATQAGRLGGLSVTARY